MGLLNVACPDAGGEAINGVVCFSHNFFRIAERDRRYYGPENLFPDHFHILIRVNQNSWLDEIATIAVTLSASDGLRAFLKTRFEVTAYTVQLLF